MKDPRRARSSSRATTDTNRELDDLVGGTASRPLIAQPSGARSHSCTFAIFRNHRYINCHAEIVIGRADKTAGDGNRLTDVTGDRNAYQVVAADRPVRWVVGNPAPGR